MKTISQNLLLAAFIFAGPLVFCQEKIALIVAIGDYPPESGWMKINSHNDVPLVMDALLAQGFQEEDITVLKDADATKKGIVKAIRSQLINRAKRGRGRLFPLFRSRSASGRRQ